MLIKAKKLEHYKLDSLNGKIGQITEFYFDDRYWIIRYLVVNTGNWLTGRQVLISPYALVGANRLERIIATDLTKEQIEKSPSLDSDKPVSHQFEQAYYGHYEYPMYWGGPFSWGYVPYIERNRKQWKKTNTVKKRGILICAALTE